MAATLKLAVTPNCPSVASTWVDQRMSTCKDGYFQVEVYAICFVLTGGHRTRIEGPHSCSTAGKFLQNNLDCRLLVLENTICNSI